MDCVTLTVVSLALPHFPFSYLFTRCKVRCVTKLAGVYTKTLKAPLQGVPCSLTESQLLSAFNYGLQVVFGNILLSMLSAPSSVSQLC